jgi:hypothetical protein
MARDYGRAVGWYEKSAAQGVPAAQNNLGLMHAQGRGVPRNADRAAELWQSAAAQDHPIAQYNLGLAFFRGDGVAEDRGQAAEWFGRAARQGLADAQFALGQVHHLGLAGERNESEALKWYDAAAAQGHKEAEAQRARIESTGVAAPASKPRVRVAGTQTASRDPQRREVAVKAPVVAVTGGDAAAPPPQEAPPKQTSTEQVSTTEVAKQVGATDTSRGAVPGDAPGGAFSIWLASHRKRDAAEDFLQVASQAHETILAGASLRIATVDHGKGGTFYRVIAEGLETGEAARARCARLKSQVPGSFCKVLSE